MDYRNNGRVFFWGFLTRFFFYLLTVKSHNLKKMHFTDWGMIYSLYIIRSEYNPIYSTLSKLVYVVL